MSDETRLAVRHHGDGGSSWIEVIRHAFELPAAQRMTRPTLEELRARVGSQRDGGHWSRRYAAEPGTGPAGKTCHDCAFLRYTGQARPTSHPKCGKTQYTSGDATTIKTRTAACRLFEESES